MNPFQRMELHKSDFTQNDWTIYRSIAENPSQVTYKTISTLAADCGVSQPALTRFVKGLGYARYQDFRSDLITWLAQQKKYVDLGTERLSYFETLFQTLQSAEKLLTQDYLEELARYVCSSRRVYASGIGKSFHPALLLEQLMYKNSRIVHAVTRDALAEVSSYMNPNDLLILFSVSGSLHLMGEITECNGKVILVTANPRYTNPTVVDHAVVLPYSAADPENSSVSPVLFDVFVELLVDFISRSVHSEPI
ncbi:MAG: MurR/RpiR family transcriptional regulator [Faecalibacterium sp.]